MTSCALGDVACGVSEALTNILMPIVVPAFILIALLFIGAFGGKVGKVVAIGGVLFMGLWYFGLEWAGIPLPPLKQFTHAVVLGPLLAKEVRHVKKDLPMSRATKAGLVLIAAAIVLSVLIGLKVV